jgi:ADP-heptose:LPS heptosyltransferase
MGNLKVLEHGIKVAVFRACAWFLDRRQREVAPLDGNALHKVLFLRPDKIGDMVISFPVFDGLRREYPHIEQSVLGSPRNRAVIAEDFRFAKVFMYRKNLWKDIREIRAMRREKFDCVVDMICDDSVTTLFLSRLCAPGKPRIGVGKDRFRKYYDFNYDRRTGHAGHIIQNTLTLLTAFGIDPAQVNPYSPPCVSEQDREIAERFVSSVRQSFPAARLIGYNLSAGSPTRLWSREKSGDLVKRILVEVPDTTVLLIVTPADRERALAIQADVGGQTAVVPDHLSLLQASAIVSRLHLLISPDTSLIHIARSFQVPVVGLYSRFMKNFLHWRPYGQELGAVLSGNDDSIHDITVDQAVVALREVIAELRLESR